MIPTVTLLKKMMAFRPVSADVAAVNRLVDFLNDYLKRQGVYTRVEKLNGRKILYAATRPTRQPDLLFLAHLDVVPAAPAVFRPRQRGGFLWGRGSGDCLGNSVILAQMLVKCRKQADAGVVFSTDEEIGGHTTARMYRKGYRGRMVVIMDFSHAGHAIAVAQKGVLTLKLIARGKASHGSRPWRGINAIDRLIAGYQRVKRLFPVIRSGDEWHPSLSANVIHAGTAHNVVPDQAEMILDIRYTRPADAVALVRRIRRASGLEVEVQYISPVVHCPAHHPLVRGLHAFMERRLRRSIPVVRMNGATDARHYAALKVPMVMAAIPSAGGPHTPQERIPLDSLKAYEGLLTDICRQGLPGLMASK